MDRPDEILEIEEYGELFEPSLDRIKEKYLALVKQYHPDSWSDKRAADVVAHISGMKNQAVEDLQNGIWKQKNRINLEMKRGGWISVQYYQSSEFELGKYYIGKERILYLIDEEYRDFHKNAVDRIGRFRFANEKMKEEFIPFLPRIIKQGITKDNSYILLLDKNPDEYQLTDVWQRMDRKIDARNVAWMISRLNSLCCYLQYIGIAHNGMIPDNLYINPGEHTISLYGGWWYAVDEGAKLIGTTAEVYDMMSDTCKAEKLAECRTDQEMVHEIAKILLDNKSMVFKSGDSTDIPPAMASWIRNGTGGDAFAEFDNWNKTLDSSWGKRKFVELKVPGIDS